MFACRSLVVIAALTLSATSNAQDGVDWGGLMATEAAGSATREAAREGARARPARRSSDASRDSRVSKTKSDCAKIRKRVAAGMRDAQLSLGLKLCKQLGY
jgi:hypothetical protein